jgi:hypothetical protein
MDSLVVVWEVRVLGVSWGRVLGMDRSLTRKRGRRGATKSRIDGGVSE